MQVFGSSGVRGVANEEADAVVRPPDRAGGGDGVGGRPRRARARHPDDGTAVRERGRQRPGQRRPRRRPAGRTADAGAAGLLRRGGRPGDDDHRLAQPAGIQRREAGRSGRRRTRPGDARQRRGSDSTPSRGNGSPGPTSARPATSTAPGSPTSTGFSTPSTERPSPTPTSPSSSSTRPRRRLSHQPRLLPGTGLYGPHRQRPAGRPLPRP